MAEHVDQVRAVPPISLGAEDVARLTTATETIATRLGTPGACCPTFALSGGVAHVLEIRSHASQSAAAAIGVPLADAALRVTFGTPIAALRASAALTGHDRDRITVLHAAGAVAVDDHFGGAFARAMAAANTPLPTCGRAFVSLRNRRGLALPLRALTDLGFTALAAGDTAEVLRRHGIPFDLAPEDVAGLVRRGEVQLVVTDEPRITAEAAARGIPHITTTDGLVAAVQGIGAARLIQDSHRERGASR